MGHFRRDLAGTSAGGRTSRGRKWADFTREKMGLAEGTPTCRRDIITSRAWRARADHIEQKIREGTDYSIAEQDAPVIHQLVQQDVVRFMTMTEFGGQPHPIQTVYTQKIYGLKIRYLTNGNGQTGWSGANSDTISVRTVQFSKEQIRMVIHSLLATTRQRLVENLMFVVPSPQSWRHHTIEMQYCCGTRLASGRTIWIQHC
jgi:hypothetical protein